jgi:hypothetical protein
VRVVNDAAHENTEKVALALASSASYPIGASASAELTIQDNDPDPRPIVWVAASQGILSEGSAAAGNFRIGRTEPLLNRSLRVALTLSGSAVFGSDYTLTANGVPLAVQAGRASVLLPAGARSANISVRVVNDAAHENTEKVALALASSASYRIGASASAELTIRDNDPTSLPTVVLAAPPRGLSESDASVRIFRIDRVTGSLQAPLPVAFTLSGSATRNRDYIVTGDGVAGPQDITATIPAGARSARVSLNVVDDAVHEREGEEIGIALAPRGHYHVGPVSTAELALEDNDALTNGAIRSNLYALNDEVLGHIYTAVASGPFESVRNRLATSWVVQHIPIHARRNAERMAALQERGIEHFLVQLHPAPADFDDPDPRRHLGLCGHGGGSLAFSEINIDKYKARLAANLSEMKRLGINVIAFEVGNEINTACFNADVPVRETSRPPTQAEFRRVVDGYARVFVAAAEVALRPEFYPTAHMVTGGLSGINGGNVYNGRNIPNPGRIIGALKGIPYKNGSVFDLIDGIGVHYYALLNTPQSIRGIQTGIALTEAAAGGTGKPYWITEWFAGNREREADNDLYDAFSAFYRAVLSQAVPVAAMYVTHIGNDNSVGANLLDENYDYYPDIRFFRETIPPSLSISAVPQAVASGAAATISWSSHNIIPSSCRIRFRIGTSYVVFSRDDRGTRSTGALTSARTYTLTCSKYGGGTVSEDTVVSVR